MENKDIRIALVDDHQLIRAGLARLLQLEEGIDVVAQAPNGKVFLDLLPSQPVDVVLLDMDMPVMDGRATLEQLVAHYPEVKVIVLTVHEHDSFIVHMMESGAHGYLLKDSEPEEVVTAIKTVYKEGIYFNNRVSKALLKGLSRGNAPHATNLGESLNQRELDILSLICKEYTTAQIADELFLSQKTIEGYRKSLLEKTQTKNMAGLAVFAVKNKLV